MNFKLTWSLGFKPNDKRNWFVRSCLWLTPRLSKHTYGSSRVVARVVHIPISGANGEFVVQTKWKEHDDWTTHSCPEHRHATIEEAKEDAVGLVQAQVAADILDEEGRWYEA